MLGRIKQVAKRAINTVLPVSLQYRQGTKRNILLFASRRGGSTILNDLILCDPRIRGVTEPFNLTDFDVRRKRLKESYLPPVPFSEFISLSALEEEKIRSYMHLLLNGRISELDPYMPPKNRTAIKILCAIPLIDWFAEHFDVQSIYLVRHPIPQALSSMRQNWIITSEAYLANPVFSRRCLSASQRHVGMKIMETGTKLEKYVLNWILQNLYPLKYAKKIDLTLTYEELTLLPNQVINLVAKTLGINYVAAMQRRIKKPSGSHQFSERETNEAILRKDTDYVLNRWMSKIGQPTKDKIADLMSAFDIYEYHPDRPFPTEKLCHFFGQAPEFTIEV